MFSSALCQRAPAAVWPLKRSAPGVRLAKIGGATRPCGSFLPPANPHSASLQRCSANSDDVNAILAKYGGGGSPQQQPTASAQGITAKQQQAVGNGVFLLILINVTLFLLDKVAHVAWVQQLYLNHAKPQWFQFITSAFCHGGWDHLSMNMFNLLIFGKLIEETEGAFGVWFTYLVTALGGSVALYLTTPAIKGKIATVSLGASGAVFGMFAVAVLLRLTFNFRKLLEAAILGQFVVRQVLHEVKAQVAGGLMLGGANIAHMAHLGGAMVGVLLVLILAKLPDDQSSK